ncbi:hypothetical protein Mlute_00133 [Meiothermus luteus]|jgi:threonine/homoserine/homoserine lactone efflux protein|uniref:Prokaryotic cytochrome b561 n=1 Tax=Meiothermus luteus TaxID=2026184 RepID=A0A399EZP9_9DEIN|nr:hypothetical protein [Meiothermus luteus]RIH90014.1 hypothetical protein Mlute_00133 [Meiothermus luteus]RMH53513.1 MAG: hypothetical protein D6684_12090 [Deinococcota bacterium]
MYELLLTFHNLARWLVLLAAAYLLYRAWTGLRRRSYTPADRRAGLAYTALMDLQLLVGALLMVFSPFMASLYADPSAAMKASPSRFFLAEHWVLMLLAVVLVHLGSARVRKASSDELKQRQALLWYGLSLALVLLAIPWWRPLLRLG